MSAALTYSGTVFVSGAGRVIYSASDLAAAARCEYALLRAFDAKLGRGPTVEVEETNCSPAPPISASEHEQRLLDEFANPAPRSVAIIGRPATPSPA